MPTLVASYAVQSETANTDTLVTEAFTPANGEVLVVKMTTWDTSSTMNAPTANGVTFSEAVVHNPASAKPWMAIYVATVAGSPVDVVVSATHSATPSIHSLVVERWESATLGDSIVSGVGSDDGQPLASLVTTGDGSAISAVNADWHGNTGAIAYRNSGVEVFAFQSGGNTAHYYWYQDVPVAGLTEFGMTAPDGQSYALAGIELLHVDSGTSVVLGTVHDTGLGISIGKAKQRALGTLTGTHTLGVAGRAKSLSISSVSDSQIALSLDVAKHRLLGLVSELGTVHGGGRLKTATLGLVSELDQVLSYRITKRRMLGFASDVNAVIELAGESLGTARDANTVFGLAKAKRTDIGIVVSADIAYSLTRIKSHALAVIGESNSAASVHALKTLVLGLITEIDNTLSLENREHEVSGSPLTDNALILVSRGNRYRRK